MTVREKIMKFMENENYNPMSKEELAVEFDMGSKDLKKFYEVIDQMEKEGLVVKTKNAKYGLIDNEYLITGKLQGHERGFGFLIPEDKERKDIFVPAENMNGAMHGDKVIVNITRRGDEDKREEGEIIKILERKNTTIVGTFEDNKNFGFVVPDERKIGYDIFIPKARSKGAKTNHKVVIEITTWPMARRNPEGKVIEVLGYLSEQGTDILSIIRQFELPEGFPKQVKKIAQEIPQEVDKEEAKKRVDLRDLNTFTIDGADAKDIDDAVSIELKENGNYYLGVHIADVSHYVKMNSIIDKEAYKRGNSVYLIDRVIPMLPEELSNGICSLNPDVDRLCLTVFMEIDKNGKVIDNKIVEGLMNSKHRLVYDDVSDFLEDDDTDAKEKLKGITEDLKLMEELMDILYEKRERRGSINFDFPETEITLDKNGVPVEIKKRDRRIADKLIEEFMLVCNETVGERFFWSDIPFLYRTHDEPSPEKITAFSKVLHNFGYSIKGQQEVHPKELQLLSKEIKGKKEEPLLSTLMLRSMKKAIYSEEQGIHFGLAAEYYSHFTAPIRRYSDLVVHRIIKEYINGRLDKKLTSKLDKTLPDIAEQVSMTEKRAEEAEREVEDMKKAQYMKKHIGEEFDGIISSLTNFGIFIQLENTIEGLVHFNNMLDDYYHFDEENYHIIGDRTKKMYKLGDEVKIRVTNSDVMKRDIDFEIVEKIDS